jgi:hypothetical protein
LKEGYKYPGHNRTTLQKYEDPKAFMFRGEWQSSKGRP